MHLADRMETKASKFRARRSGSIPEKLLWIALACFTVVLPNAFKDVAAFLLVVTASYYVLTKRNILSRNLLLIWLSTSIVTAVYIMVGLLNGAPDEARDQVIIIYIISPLLWTIALRGALDNLGLRTIVKFLLLFTAPAILSQAFYYWAFPSGRYSEILELMAGSPNLDYSHNQISAVMFVFGSMIFLYAGFLASPDVIDNKILRLIFVLTVLVSAITSGRSALILCTGIGIVAFVLMSFSSLRQAVKSIAVNIPPLALAILVGSYALWSIYDIDISVGIGELVEKLASGGGAGRQEYLPQLLLGAAEHFFLGAGHGIGVEFTVSEKFPWRYEVVGAATLFRVGILGTLIYSLPFLLALRSALHAYRGGGLDMNERYLLGALIAVIVAANTNPYIEAIVFQWMYVLPCVYFIDLRCFR